MAYPSLTTSDLADTGQAATGIGGVIGALGSIRSGYAESDAAKYQAQIAQNNAAIAGRNAQWASSEGDIEAQNQSLKTRAQVGATIAGAAANGLDVNSGSAKQVVQSEQMLGRLDAMTIRSNAARQAYGYLQQGQNFEGEAALKEAEAKNDVSAGFMGAGSSLLSSASQLGRQYAAWQNEYGSGSPPATLAGQ